MNTRKFTLIAATFGVAALFSSLAPAQQQLSIVWEAHRNVAVVGVADIPGTGLVAVARDNKVEIREWNSGALVRVIDPLIPGSIYQRSLSANSDGIIAFTATHAFLDAAFVFLADALTGRVTQRWQTQLPYPQDTALSPDGRYLAVISTQQRLMYDLDYLGAPPVELNDSVEPVGNIADISFSPASTQIFASDTSGWCRVWNVTGGDPVWRRNITDPRPCKWSTAGLYVGTATKVYRLNAADGTDASPPMNTTSPTIAIATNSSGLVGAYPTAGHYGFSNDLSVGPVVYTNTSESEIEFTYDIAGRQGFPQYAVATEDRFSIYQTQTPTTAGNPTELFTTFDPAAPEHRGVILLTVAWSPDGNWVATGPWTSNVVRIFNATTGALIHNVTLTSGDEVWSLDFNPASTELAVGCFRSSAPSAIRRINTTTGTVVGSISIADDTTPVSVQYTNDGQRIMACNGASGRRIRIYNLDGTVWAESPQLTSTFAFFTSAVLSPDGTRIAATTQGAEKKVRVYNVSVSPPSITLAQQTLDQDSAPRSCSWGPGNRVAVVFPPGFFLTGDSQVAVYDASDLSLPPIAVWNVPSSYLFSVSYRGDNVVAGGDGGIYFFSVSKKQKVAEFQGTSRLVTKLVFNPSGDRFAFVTTESQLAVAQSPATDNRQTLFFQDPATRLIVAWRLTGGNVVVLPTVTIDSHNPDWEPRAFGADALGANSNIYFQNTSSGPQARRLAYWTLANSGVPTEIGPLLLTVEPNWVLRTAGDVNQDGVADLIFQNTATNAVAVWFRAENGAIVGTNLIGIGAAGWEVVGAGPWLPGTSRLVWYNSSSGQIVTWTLSPAGAPSNPQTIGYAVPASEWRLRGLGNLGDNPTLYFENLTTGAVWVWTIDDSTVINVAPVDGTVPSGWRLIGVGQLNP